MSHHATLRYWTNISLFGYASCSRTGDPGIVTQAILTIDLRGKNYVQQGVMHKIDTLVLLDKPPNLYLVSTLTGVPSLEYQRRKQKV